jgi:CheY-like chemotaxis protein
MVYGFAKQSGGTLRLTSKVGEGTRAELWLPRALDTDKSARSRNFDKAEPESHRSLSILLIDDHAEVRATTSAMLSDLGHKVAEAGSGSEADQILKANGVRFDLLITDYAMPKQSGTEVVRAAREYDHQLPALIITGYANEAEIGTRPENVDVLTKPFTLTELASAVGRAVSPDQLPEKQ